MSRYYQDIDAAGGIDYALHEIPGLGWRKFRGPPVDLSRPYIAFVGSAHTFGRFVIAPYPTLLGERLGLQVLNLGVGGTGPRHFDIPAYLELLNNAEAVVLQVLSGRSASNSMFSNAENGSHTGRRLSDGKEMRAEDFFRELGNTATLDEIRRIVAETRADYCDGYISLLAKIETPRILFWLSNRTPAYKDDYGNLPFSLFSDMPQLVNSPMIRDIAAACDAYIECVSTVGLPQPLWHAGTSVDGAVCRNGLLENRYYPSPEMHVLAADALEDICRRHTGTYPLAREPATQAISFVVIGAERTGTNLLISLLNDIVGCACGFELFNPINIDKGIIPWDHMPDDDQATLEALRRTDPVGFWERLYAASEAAGQRATGFKLLYGHAMRQPALLDRLVGDQSLRVIHLTRRNLLRRLVSERQAQESGRWAEGWASRPISRKAVTIELNEVLACARDLEAQEASFDALFARHAVLKLYYEDLARHPFRVLRRAAAFLGLPEHVGEKRIKFRKTGAEQLSDALENADELRAQVRKIARYFD